MASRAATGGGRLRPIASRGRFAPVVPDRAGTFAIGRRGFIASPRANPPLTGPGMSERENLFRPIHKGIRSMLYDLGSRLQTTNFADVAESNRFAARLKHDLENSLSNCMLCLLRAHSNHEERDIFAKLQGHDPDVIDLMLKEHGEAARRIHEVSKTCDELTDITSRARRIEVGDRLDLEVNDLFAFYLAHLNNEEAALVPLLWERFTDEQLRAMRSQFYDGLPLPLFETWMRWTLPSLNEEELVVLFSGLKAAPATARYPDWVRLAHETLDFDRWLGLQERVGVNVLPGTSGPA